MRLAEKHQQWVTKLRAFRDSQERMSYLVKRARESQPFPEAKKDEAHRITGCVSKLWFDAEIVDGRCLFSCDSDSAMVKGVAVLLCEFYSGATPSEILCYEGDALAESGIQGHLSQNRRNGLAQVRQRIRDFAAEAAAAESAGLAVEQPAKDAPPLYDAHNHLQDPRLGTDPESLIRTAAQAGVTRMVVNGSCEEDWPRVKELAAQFPMVLPSFGYHPWYVGERTPHWKERLLDYLEIPGSAIGEVGLDRWIPNPQLEAQQEVFLWQLRLATERNLPLSIHCLKAWGMLEELLKKEARPDRGFLLHSFGGPVEMLPSLARLGAYFSFPGYFLQERKAKQRETFRHVPPERLLIETDAPDQLLPPERCRFPLTAPGSADPVNHPANLKAVYEGLADFLGTPRSSLAAQVAENFGRFFAAA